MIAKVVYVHANLTDNIIRTTAKLADNIINAEGELVNKVSYTEAEEYDGAYEVTSFLAAPSLATSLILPTKAKIMRDDVTFYSVPTTEEYNAQGGVTFTIGG